jgi:hypothetical protein
MELKSGIARGDGVNLYKEILAFSYPSIPEPESGMEAEGAI